MMSLFSKLPSWLSLTGSRLEAYRADEVTAALNRMRDYLNGTTNPIVRVYADAGGGSGQQAAAVRLLDRLFAPANAPVPGTGVPGQNKTVQVVYNDEAPTTVTNLRRLMQWPATQNSGQYQGGQVDLLPWSQRATLAAANVCLSAACDRTGDGHGSNMAQALNVSWFLRLQPFMYSKPDELQIANPPSATNLATVAQLGGASFHERGLRLEVPAQFDWNPYINSSDATIRRRSQVMQWLINNRAGNYELLVTYGIHTGTSSSGDVNPSAIGAEPYDQATQLVAGALATQRGPQGQLQGAAPIVIVNLDDFYVDAGDGGYRRRHRFRPVRDALTGGFSVEELRNLGNDASPTMGAGPARGPQPLGRRTSSRSTPRPGRDSSPSPTPRARRGTRTSRRSSRTRLLVNTQNVPPAQKVLWSSSAGCRRRRSTTQSPAARSRRCLRATTPPTWP